MYKKGLYNEQERSAIGTATQVSMAQVVIGTAPVHMTADPAAATNVPILCNNMTECRNKIGYSTKFDKYTLCQSAYASFQLFGVAPIVFINVLDVTKHKKSVESAPYSVNNNSIVIDDDVIVSSLVIEKTGTPIEKTKYVTEWNDGKLVVNFTETTTGSVDVEYDAVDPAKVTASDIIGAYSTETEKRTGLEVIDDVYAKTGAVPLLLLAPGFSDDDTVGAILNAKTTEIAGAFDAVALLDLACTAGSTRASVIAARKARTAGENSIFFFPKIKRGEYTLSFSAYAAAAMMNRAADTAGVVCNGIDNYAMNIDACVLDDGTNIYYNQPDGNELVGEGIVTIISRNGYYAWGNNTAAYPTDTAPENRFINMRLSFIFAQNDFIARNAGREIDIRTLEDMLTDENIKLAAWSASGYIIDGRMTFDAADNSVEDISNGIFTLRTSLAPNTKAEVVTNIFRYDAEAVQAAINTLAGTIGGTV